VLKDNLGAAAGTMGFRHAPGGYAGQLYAAGYPGQVCPGRGRRRGPRAGPKAGGPSLLERRRPGFALPPASRARGARALDFPAPQSIAGGRFYTLRGTCVVEDTDGTDGRLDFTVG
jgi:hypothetical protein